MAIMTDLGGSCIDCGEDANWVVTDSFINDEDDRETHLKCHTAIFDEYDDYDTLCENSILVLEEK